MDSYQKDLLDFPDSYEQISPKIFEDERLTELCSERSKNKKTICPATHEILEAIDLGSIALPKSENFCLDPTKVENYLSKIDNDILETIKALFHNTKYVTFCDLISVIDRLLSDFISSNHTKSFYIYFPTSFSSENIIVMFLWSKLRVLDIKGFITQDHKFPSGETVEILIFDDCIFTGQNIDLTFFTLSSNNPDTFLIFNLFLGYSSKQGLNLVRGSLDNPFSPYHYNNTHLISYVHEILDDVMFDTLFIEKCNEYYGSRLPLYFDYKIPITTCEYIYNGADPITSKNLGYTTKHLLKSDFKTSAYEAYIKACNL